MMTISACPPAQRALALLEDELHDLLGDPVSRAEEQPGNDHKPDDHAGGLHYLPPIRPLYSLQLVPAALQESAQAGEEVRVRLADCVAAAASFGPRDHRAGAASTVAVTSAGPSFKRGRLFLREFTVQ